MFSVPAHGLDYPVISQGSQNVCQVSPLRAIPCVLNEPHLVPGCVVCDNSNHGQIKADERIIIKTGTPEGPIAEKCDYFSCGKGRFGSDGKWRTDS